MAKGLPNELLVQLDGKEPFKYMSKNQQLTEIEWCIDRVNMWLAEELDEFEPDREKIIYYKKQLKQLKKLKTKVEEFIYGKQN